tara:strand:- start:397 stop:606 length:210 start_codon:yes stop_codon:yes gene_type:complete
MKDFRVPLTPDELKLVLERIKEPKVFIKETEAIIKEPEVSEESSETKIKPSPLLSKLPSFWKRLRKNNT